MTNVSHIVNGLLALQTKYATTYRAMTTAERYNGLIKSGLIQSYSPDQEVFREPLIEHVGHLPIIATYLYQFVEKKRDIDLGKALTMLAIHDIGETEAGDVISYSKTKELERSELEFSKQLIPKELIGYFNEFQENHTFSAKFANTVDNIAPLLHDLVLPEITIERFNFFSFDTDKIVDKKRTFFEWDSVLIKIFDYIIAEYRKIGH